MNSLKKLVSLFALVLLLTSCQNTVQKSIEFVEKYNNLTNNLQNTMLLKSNAKLIDEKVPKEFIIDINYDISLTKKEYTENLYKDILPKEVKNLFQEEIVSDLIKSGAKINLIFHSFDNYTVENILLDNNKISEIIKDSNNKTVLNTKQKDLQKLLDVINSKFPSEITKFDAKIVKLELGEWNNVNCYIEVKKNLTKEEEVDLRDKILENENIISFLETEDKEKLEVASLTFKYHTPDGKKVYECLAKI
ncbi:MAG: hypothetical protein QM535_13590 [Limnohabitans sp.]|nr:hypothetical protein [Limnohabitans sp.]